MTPVVERPFDYPLDVFEKLFVSGCDSDDFDRRKIDHNVVRVTLLSL
jgi:hypothetical protein